MAEKPARPEKERKQSLAAKSQPPIKQFSVPSQVAASSSTYRLPKNCMPPRDGRAEINVPRLHGAEEVLLKSLIDQLGCKDFAFNLAERQSNYLTVTELYFGPGTPYRPVQRVIAATIIAGSDLHMIGADADIPKDQIRLETSYTSASTTKFADQELRRIVGATSQSSFDATLPQEFNPD